MKVIPTYGICAFEIDCQSQDEGCIGTKENPSEALFIRRFVPYRHEYDRFCMPHKHDFYHFMFFLKGAGRYTIDFVKFDIKPGLAFFMTPGQIHSYAVTEETHLYLVNFSESYLQSFLHDTQYIERFPFFFGPITDSVVYIPDELGSKVKSLMDSMIEESHHIADVNRDLIKLWLLETLMLIAKQSKKEGAGSLNHKNSALISKFRKLVEENFNTLSLPKDYAEMLFVTPSYLNQMSRKTLGKRAGEVIRERKLLEAKRLLVNQDLHISQISHNLNFTDPSHFSHFFKKQTGKSPEDFRKNAFEAQ